ncbi:MAG: CotH kinase family protein [Oscillospiraceae bacterium]|jgi:hypothetical protein|nr:CotH kinase family protein [Oscillospiraceae bacterium]
MKTTKKLLSLLLAVILGVTAFSGLTSVFAAEEDATQYVYGDANMDGRVSIEDVTAIQSHLAQLTIFNRDAENLADVDGAYGVNIVDATVLQKYLAHIDGNDRIGDTYNPEDAIPSAEIFTPAIPFATTSALYAHGVAYDEDETQDAWTKWEQFSNAYYFFLPTSANKKFVEIYNGYGSNVKINGITIPAKKSRYIPYTANTEIAVSGAKSCTLRIKTSSTEGAMYFNTLNEADQYDANEFKLVSESGDKSYSTSGNYVLADEDGLLQTGTVKKFKGRGNTTWQKAKKPFNVNFDDTVKFNGLEGKKFSLLANYQDSSNLRNRLIYDMADELGLQYSPDSRFIDFYVNGNYEGTYQMSDKVEMGKKHLVAYEDNASETVTSNFNFLIELGIYAEDEICVSTSRGSYGQLKNPESDASTPDGAAQLQFIKQKFQQLEDALYSKNLTTLAQIADVDSFAKMYLINEFVKNVDGGNYSTFFAYNASTDKFMATPVWDFDCSIGNLNDGAARVSIEKPDGFYTKELADMAGDVNWLAKFLQASGAEARVAAIYKEKFPGIMNVLNGNAESTNGHLKSIAEYEALLTDAMAMNYKMWPYAAEGSWAAGPVGQEIGDSFNWIPDQTNLAFINSNLSTTNKTYSENLSGSIKFIKDWLNSRYNWLNNYYSKY